ncbi:membrane protein insertase YidC [Oceaniglobus trochenteri]|uniref:membrane protein insertase YidC n=1 Tax=Oceaniglobus trochenteri TaxID=2763260 RepID=UPI001CFF70C3|nr:membrane protein insertase YidC [Oceaniglobus trochenteri]
MDDQNKNLILATALSFIVILGWFVLFPPEEQVTDPNAPVAGQTADLPPTAAPAPGTATAPQPAAPGGLMVADADTPRIAVETPSLVGSLSLLGGRIDQLSLQTYRETLAPDAPLVDLLQPVGTAHPYYAVFGWAPGGALGFEDVPGPNTLWTQSGGTTLTVDSPVQLTWDNGKGLIFRRDISVDDKFMFTVTQSVENTTDGTVRMAPYGTISRQGNPPNLSSFFILHEGVVRMSDGELQEIDYDDMPDQPSDERWGANADVISVSENGWLGFTDKYWMTSLVPQPGSAFTSVVKYNAGADIYQTEARLAAMDIAAGTTAQSTSRMFAGAKEWDTIRDYQNDQGVEGFIDSIDWGWFFFLTKPIFFVLHWLHAIFGNMGWSIIALTFFLKALLFPLAYKSYVSMAKMKELQPEMEALKERAGDDRQKMQQGMMELYKKNKVNPASGCLPILLQIPIFFSLYKVIFVTIELRHAPWVGWIRDLSAPDPSSILNLFGLLPWATPEPGSIFFILSLGVLPILLGISMWLQQKLNPAPTDPTQKMIFAWMPWVFMFMLGSFASGLVLYWITNNTITFTQQYLIMRSQGYKPDVFGNIMSGFKRGKSTEKPDTKAPANKNTPKKRK